MGENHRIRELMTENPSAVTLEPAGVARRA